MCQSAEWNIKQPITGLPLNLSFLCLWVNRKRYFLITELTCPQGRVILSSSDLLNDLLLILYTLYVYVCYKPMSHCSQSEYQFWHPKSTLHSENKPQYMFHHLISAGLISSVNIMHVDGAMNHLGKQSWLWILPQERFTASLWKLTKTPLWFRRVKMKRFGRRAFSWKSYVHWDDPKIPTKLSRWVQQQDIRGASRAFTAKYIHAYFSSDWMNILLTRYCPES